MLPSKTLRARLQRLVRALRLGRQERRGWLLQEIVELASKDRELWRTVARAEGLLYALSEAERAIDEQAFGRHLCCLEDELLCA